MLGVPEGIDLNTEFPDFNATRVDALVWSDGCVHHVEFQSWNDPAMPLRMLDYFNSIVKYIPSVGGENRRDISQRVLYVGTPTISMESSLSVGQSSLVYELNDIREFENEYADLLEASERPLDWIVAYLCRNTTPDAQAWRNLAHHVLDHLRSEGCQSHLALAACLLVAATLRRIDIGVRREIVEMFKMSIENDPLLRSIYDQAIDYGVKADYLELIEEALAANEVELSEPEKAALVSQRSDVLRGITRSTMRGINIYDAIRSYIGDHSSDYTGP